MPGNPSLYFKINCQECKNCINARYSCSTVGCGGWLSKKPFQKELAMHGLTFDPGQRRVLLLVLNTFCKALSTITKVSLHFHLKFVQSGWWVVFRLKWGLFENKMSLGCISVYPNNKKSLPDFVETINDTLWFKYSSF